MVEKKPKKKRSKLKGTFDQPCKKKIARQIEFILINRLAYLSRTDSLGMMLAMVRLVCWERMIRERSNSVITMAKKKESKFDQNLKILQQRPTGDRQKTLLKGHFPFRKGVSVCPKLIQEILYIAANEVPVLWRVWRVSRVSTGCRHFLSLHLHLL